jgi:hypothetical protein
VTATTCESIRPEIPWLANQTLPRQQRAAAWAHLSTCPSCREELKDWLLLQETLQEGSPEPHPLVLQATWQALAHAIRPALPPLRIRPTAPPLAIAADALTWAIAVASARS